MEDRQQNKNKYITISVIHLELLKLVDLHVYMNINLSLLILTQKSTTYSSHKLIHFISKSQDS